MPALADAARQRFLALNLPIRRETASKPWFLLLLVGMSCAHAALGLMAVRWHFGVGSVTYILLGQAAALGAGKSVLALDPAEPFGYPAIIDLLSFLDHDLVTVALIVSVAANAAAMFFVLAIAARLLTVFSFICLALILVTQHQILSHMTVIWAESMFVLSVVIFLFMYMVCFVEKRYNYLLLCAICSTMPFYIRYIGIFTAVIFVIHSLILLFDRKISFRICSAVMALCAVLIAPTIIRNLTVTGGVTGHAIGVAPAYTFFAALREFFYQLAQFLVFDLSQLPARESAILNSMMTYCALVAIIFGIHLAWAKREPAGVFVAPFLYIFLFAVAESITRIDLIGYRFVFPIIPLFILLVYYVYDNRTFVFRSMAVLANPLCTGLAVVLAVGGVASGAATTVRGVSPYAHNFSPATIKRVVELAEPGWEVLANRYGQQLSIYAPTLPVHLVPFGDPGNANYTEAYGIKLWTRDDLVAFVRERHIRTLVFFLGGGRSDPFLDAGQYGAFMRSVFDGADPLVERVESLPDGAIIWLREAT